MAHSNPNQPVDSTERQYMWRLVAQVMAKHNAERERACRKTTKRAVGGYGVATTVTC